MGNSLNVSMDGDNTNYLSDLLRLKSQDPDIRLVKVSTETKLESSDHIPNFNIGYTPKTTTTNTTTRLDVKYDICYDKYLETIINVKNSNDVDKYVSISKVIKDFNDDDVKNVINNCKQQNTEPENKSYFDIMGMVGHLMGWNLNDTKQRVDQNGNITSHNNDVRNRIRDFGSVVEKAARGYGTCKRCWEFYLDNDLSKIEKVMPARRLFLSESIKYAEAKLNALTL